MTSVGEGVRRGRRRLRLRMRATSLADLPVGFVACYAMAFSCSRVQVSCHGVGYSLHGLLHVSNRQARV